MSAPFPTPESTLAQLTGWWLVATCGCGHTSRPPVKMLMQEGLSPRRTVAEVSARLRCRKCGERPESVMLIDNLQLGASGYVDTSGQKPRTVALPVGGET
jgi:hypothetical protein